MTSLTSDQPVILFDAVSTIIFPQPDVITAYHQTAANYGSKLSLEEVRQGFQDLRQSLFDSELAPDKIELDKVELVSSDQIEFDLWRCLVERLFTDVSDSQGLFHALWSHFAIASNWQVYEDVFDCWSQLKDMNFRIGIASNFDYRLFELCRQLLPGDVDFVFCSARTGYRKPDYRFFHAVQSQLSGENAPIMVGDDLVNDYLAPISFGWQSFLIDRKSRHHGYPSLKSLSELAELLAVMI